MTDYNHSDHLVVRLEANPPHTLRNPSHFPRISFTESNRHPTTSRQDDIIGPISELDIDQLVVFSNVNRIYSVGPDVLVLSQARLLHHSLSGSENQRLFIGKCSDANDRCNFLILVNP